MLPPGPHRLVGWVRNLGGQASTLWLDLGQPGLAACADGPPLSCDGGACTIPLLVEGSEWQQFGLCFTAPGGPLQVRASALHGAMVLEEWKIAPALPQPWAEGRVDFSEDSGTCIVHDPVGETDALLLGSAPEGTEPQPCAQWSSAPVQVQPGRWFLAVAGKRDGLGAGEAAVSLHGDAGVVATDCGLPTSLGCDAAGCGFSWTVPADADVVKEQVCFDVLAPGSLIVAADGPDQDRIQVIEVSIRQDQPDAFHAEAAPGTLAGSDFLAAFLLPEDCEDHPGCSADLGFDVQADVPGGAPWFEIAPYAPDLTPYLAWATRWPEVQTALVERWSPAGGASKPRLRVSVSEPSEALLQDLLGVAWTYEQIPAAVLRPVGVEAAGVHPRLLAAADALSGCSGDLGCLGGLPLAHPAIDEQGTGIWVRLSLPATSPVVHGQQVDALQALPWLEPPHVAIETVDGSTRVLADGLLPPSALADLDAAPPEGLHSRGLAPAERGGLLASPTLLDALVSAAMCEGASGCLADVQARYPSLSIDEQRLYVRLHGQLGQEPLLSAIQAEAAWGAAMLWTPDGLPFLEDWVDAAGWLGLDRLSRLLGLTGAVTVRSHFVDLGMPPDHPPGDDPPPPGDGPGDGEGPPDSGPGSDGDGSSGSDGSGGGGPYGGGGPDGDGSGGPDGDGSGTPPSAEVDRSVDAAVTWISGPAVASSCGLGPETSHAPHASLVQRQDNSPSHPLEAQCDADGYGEWCGNVALIGSFFDDFLQCHELIEDGLVGPTTDPHRLCEALPPSAPSAPGLYRLGVGERTASTGIGKGCLDRGGQTWNGNYTRRGDACEASEGDEVWELSPTFPDEWGVRFRLDDPQSWRAWIEGRPGARTSLVTLESRAWMFDPLRFLLTAEAADGRSGVAGFLIQPSQFRLRLRWEVAFDETRAVPAAATEWRLADVDVELFYGDPIVPYGAGFTPTLDAWLSDDDILALGEWALVNQLEDVVWDQLWPSGPDTWQLAAERPSPLPSNSAALAAFFGRFVFASNPVFDAQSSGDPSLRIEAMAALARTVEWNGDAAAECGIDGNELGLSVVVSPVSPTGPVPPGVGVGRFESKSLLRDRAESVVSDLGIGTAAFATDTQRDWSSQPSIGQDAAEPTALGALTLNHELSRGIGKAVENLVDWYSGGWDDADCEALAQDVLADCLYACEWHAPDGETPGQPLPWVAQDRLGCRLACAQAAGVYELPGSIDDTDVIWDGSDPSVPFSTDEIAPAGTGSLLQQCRLQGLRPWLSAGPIASRQDPWDLCIGLNHAEVLSTPALVRPAQGRVFAGGEDFDRQDVRSGEVDLQVREEFDIQVEVALSIGLYLSETRCPDVPFGTENLADFMAWTATSGVGPWLMPLGVDISTVATLSVPAAVVTSVPLRSTDTLRAVASGDGREFDLAPWRTAEEWMAAMVEESPPPSYMSLVTAYNAQLGTWISDLSQTFAFDPYDHRRTELGVDLDFAFGDLFEPIALGPIAVNATGYLLAGGPLPAMELLLGLFGVGGPVPPFVATPPLGPLTPSLHFVLAPWQGQILFDVLQQELRSTGPDLPIDALKDLLPLAAAAPDPAVCLGAQRFGDEGVVSCTTPASPSGVPGLVPLLPLIQFFGDDIAAALAATGDGEWESAAEALQAANSALPELPAPIYIAFFDGNGQLPLPTSLCAAGGQDTFLGVAQGVSCLSPPSPYVAGLRGIFDAVGAFRHDWALRAGAVRSLMQDDCATLTGPQDLACTSAGDPRLVLELHVPDQPERGGRFPALWTFVPRAGLAPWRPGIP